jgi:hypothetical protein
MKMELDHEKQDVSLGEIVYVYEYVNEYDYAPPNKTARYPLPTNHWYGLPSCIHGFQINFFRTGIPRLTLPRPTVKAEAFRPG